MTKTIKVSNETYEKIKDQIEEEKVKEKKEKKIEIKNRWTGDIIFTSTKKTFKEAVVEAANEANLCEADLRGANLSEADLDGANLYRANLYRANLYETNLHGADLSGANLDEADLSGANLYEANLHEAKFWGRGGNTRIKKSQVEEFFKALGIIVEE